MYAIMSLMGHATPTPRVARYLSTMRALCVASTALCAGACAQTGLSLTSLSAPQESSGITTSSTPAPKTAGTTAAAPEAVQAELRKATEYWGGLYAKNPADAQAAYNYARNLKAMGEKQQALSVLQAAVELNPNHKGLLGEYGRLALEFDQISIAHKLLERADDPAQPDWRVISARGTVFAKQGLYRDAIPFYERALTLAPEQASVLNNLALAYTMEGHPDKAEPLMRRAAAARTSDERVNQNLALVLGVQGKYDEAKLAGLQGVPADKVSENVDYLRSIVKAEAKPLAARKPDPAKKSANSGWGADVFAAQ